MTAEDLQWGVAFLVVASVVVPYALGFRRRRHVDRARKEEAARLGIDRPTAQYPFIDARRCIGCGACVDACPEGDVLGIVGGTATVVNGLRCVGHGRCELACPVGAIEVGLGDLKSRQDVPVLDRWNETTVPGIYIAGELGGLALVKNAVLQAQQVIDRVAQRVAAGGGGERGVLDVVVVGAGPAGLAAAAAARARGLSHVVLEQEDDLGGAVYHYPRRKLVLAQAVDIPVWGRLKEAEYEKERLLEIFQELAQRASLDIRFKERVTGIERDGTAFNVRTASEGTVRARAVVLALGRRGTPRKLGVAGEELPKVMYQLVDAESYEGKRVLIVGGGDSAVEAAIGLGRQPRNRVTLSYRREKLVRIKKKNEERFATLLAQHRVEALFSSEVQEIRPGAVRLKMPDGAVTLANDYVFVFAGGDPPFGLLRQMGVRFGGDAAAPATGRAPLSLVPPRRPLTGVPGS